MKQCWYPCSGSPRTQWITRSVFWFPSILINTIPEYVKNADSVATFKTKLKTFLFRKYLHWFLCLTFLFLCFVLVFNVYNTWCIICHLGWRFFLFFFFSYRNVKRIGDRNGFNKHLYYYYYNYYYYYWLVNQQSLF